MRDALAILGGILIGLAIAPPLARWLAGVPPEPPKPYPERYRESEGAEETPETVRPAIPRPVRGVYAKDEAMGNWRCVWVPEMADPLRPESQRGGR